MPTVEIEYSVPHGYRRRAEDVEQKIEEELAGRVDEVVLTEGDRMDFLVRLDGDLVYSKKREGYDPDKILARLKKRLPDEAEPEAQADAAEG